MEFIFEIIGTLFFEGCFYIVSNEKIKPLYRKLMLLVITLFYWLLIYGFVYIAIKVDIFLVKLIFIGTIFSFLYFLIKLWIKVYKKKTFAK